MVKDGGVVMVVGLSEIVLSLGKLSKSDRVWNWQNVLVMERVFGTLEVHEGFGGVKSGQIERVTSGLKT